MINHHADSTLLAFGVMMLFSLLPATGFAIPKQYMPSLTSFSALADSCFSNQFLPTHLYFATCCDIQGLVVLDLNNSKQSQSWTREPGG